MQIIECEYCGNSDLPFGNVSIDLTFRKSEIICQHCNYVNDGTQSMMFCTIGCLVEYMKQVLDGDKELKWKEPPKPTIYEANNGED